MDVCTNYVYVCHIVWTGRRSVGGANWVVNGEETPTLFYVFAASQCLGVVLGASFWETPAEWAIQLS